MFIKVIIMLLWAIAVFAISNKYEKRAIRKRGIKEKHFIKLEKMVSVAFVPIAFICIGVLSDNWEQLIYSAVMLTICYILAIIDIKYRIIPNELIILMLTIGAISIIFGVTGVSLINGVIGFFAATITFIVPFVWGGKIGGGDVKLAAAVGFLTGVSGVFHVIALMGVLVIAYCIFQKNTLWGTLNSYVPMAPFIAGAFILFIAR